MINEAYLEIESLKFEVPAFCLQVMAHIPEAVDLYKLFTIDNN
jgi:hypothetical protein